MYVLSSLAISSLRKTKLLLYFNCVYCITIVLDLKAVLLLWIFYVFFSVFGMRLCASVYLCLVVICWERADLLALACGV